MVAFQGAAIMRWILGVDTWGAGIERQRFVVDTWGAGAVMWTFEVDARGAGVMRRKTTEGIGEGVMEKEATVDVI